MSNQNKSDILEVINYGFNDSRKSRVNKIVAPSDSDQSTLINSNNRCMKQEPYYGRVQWCDRVDVLHC